MLESFADADLVILVDAMQSGGKPGEIRRFDVTDEPLSADLSSFSSTHVFNLTEALELGRALGQLPGRLLVFGVEAANFDLGTPISPEVESAARELDGLIRQELDHHKSLS